MTAASTIKNMWSLLLSVGFLMAATSMLGTLLGLRASREGFSEAQIGLLMSAHFAGLVVGTLRCGRLINRIGHIRAFGAFAALCATAVCAFPLAVSLPMWLALRALLGFNLAGLYMVTESWLNAKAAPRTRATVLAIYMTTSYLALGGGQFLLGVGDLSGPALFFVATMLYSLAVVPVAVTRATNPDPVESSHFGFSKLYAISPLAVLGCFASGLVLGAFYGMGPIYAERIGMAVEEISEFMGVVIVCGLVLQVPAGRLSDRFDRRKVIVVVCLLAAAASLALVVLSHGRASVSTVAGGIDMVWANRWPWILLAASVYGGVTATLYPLSVAYANDYVAPGDMVHASAGLVLAYSLGAVLGPLGAATAMGHAGAPGLFAFNGAVAGAVAGFAAYRMTRRSWARVGGKDAFVPLPDASVTPLPMEVDPRLGSPTQRHGTPDRH